MKSPRFLRYRSISYWTHETFDRKPDFIEVPGDHSKPCPGEGVISGAQPPGCWRNWPALCTVAQHALNRISCKRLQNLHLNYVILQQIALAGTSVVPVSA